MGILNRRNAMIGWMVWQAARRLGKRRAKRALPGRRSAPAARSKSLLGLAFAAAGAGGAWFWRRRARRPEMQTEAARSQDDTPAGAA